MTTKIEWADYTWNPVTGCTPISEGCANCYAARMAKRLAGRFGYPADDPFKPGTLHIDRIGEPAYWLKPRRVFVCSMGDLFHEDVNDDMLAAVMAAIGAASNMGHTMMLLTKRPQRMLDTWPTDLPFWNPKNVWAGVTAENQASADERIPILLKVPAAVRFVSVEPMLGPVDLDGHLDVDWVICGAETGNRRRPMELAWARSLLTQCREAGVPFFFKKDSRGNRELDGTIYEELPK